MRRVPSLSYTTLPARSYKVTLTKKRKNINVSLF